MRIKKGGTHTSLLCGVPPILFWEGELLRYRTILRNETLHYHPSAEVSYGTDAEDNHIACFLSVKAKEREGAALSFRIGEESTGTLVDKE